MQILLLDFGLLVAIAIAIPALKYLSLVYTGKSDKMAEYHQERERNVFLEMIAAGYMLVSIIICSYFSAPDFL